MRRLFNSVVHKTVIGKALSVLILLCLSSFTIVVSVQSAKPWQGNIAGDEQGLLESVRAAMLEGRYLGAAFADRVSLSNVRLDQANEWAVAGIFQTGASSGGGIILGHHSAQGWEVAFPREITFSLWLNQLPPSLTSQIPMEYLQRITTPQLTRVQSTETLSGFRFPWRENETYRTTADVEWHINSIMKGYALMISD